MTIEVRRTRAARAIAWPTSQAGRLPWVLLVGALVVWWLLYRSLAPAAAAISHRVFGLARGTHLGSAVEFFLYDTPKVLLLLVLVVFAVGVLRSFFTPERSRQLLAGRREAVGNVAAAGLGVATRARS